MSPEDRHLIEKEQLIFHNLNTCEIKKSIKEIYALARVKSFLTCTLPSTDFK